MTTCTSRSLCLACSIQRTKCRSRCWQPLGTCKPHFPTSNHRSRLLHKLQCPNCPNTCSNRLQICFWLRSRQFYRITNRGWSACKPRPTRRASTKDCPSLWRRYRRSCTSERCRLVYTLSNRFRFRSSRVRPTRDKQLHILLVI